MKRKLLYTILVLFSLNGLFANIFTGARNLASGQRQCQTSLVAEIEKGLPAYKKSHNNPHAHVIHSGPKALKESQDFEKKMQILVKCIGNGSRDQHQNHLLAEKLSKNHPKFTEAVAPLCHSDQQFKQLFNPQCTIAMLADSAVKNKGQTGPSKSGKRKKVSRNTETEDSEESASDSESDSAVHTRKKAKSSRNADHHRPVISKPAEDEDDDNSEENDSSASANRRPAQQQMQYPAQQPMYGQSPYGQQQPSYPPAYDPYAQQAYQGYEQYQYQQPQGGVYDPYQMGGQMQLQYPGYGY